MFEFLSHPSAYRWFFPTMVSVVHLNPDDVNDVFPSFDSLAPALVYALALSFLRLILQTLIFQPLALYSLKLKIEPPIEPAVPMIDRAMRGKKKLNVYF